MKKYYRFFSHHTFENRTRAIKIITESSPAPMAIRAASFSVVLEAMKNIILEENEEKINPMGKGFGRKLIAELKELVNGHDESHFRNKQVILTKLEQLNQVTNKDCFLLAYELVGIQLSQDEKDCIGLRNEFLHGRIPFEDEEGKDHLQLQRIILKLHLLLCALILKYRGYSGEVINNMTYINIQNGWKVTEPLFRKYN